jgi:hypothetical protein
MSTSPNAVRPARGPLVTMLSTLIAGLKKHEQSLAPFVIAGKSYTAAQVIAAVQSRIDASQAVTPAKAAWQAAVKADRDARTGGQALLAGVRQTLLTVYAGSVDTLADFGLVGRKPRAISPETQVAAAQKAKATRAARHTMGKKQKAAIHGTVPATVPSGGGAQAPVPAPSPVTPAPAPKSTS